MCVGIGESYLLYKELLDRREWIYSKLFKEQKWKHEYNLERR